MEVVHPPPDVAVDMAVTEEADLVGDMEEDRHEDEEEGKPAEEDTVDEGDDMGTGVDTEDCDDTGCGGCLLVAVAFVLGVGLAADEVAAAGVAPLAAAAAAGLAEVAACKAADRVGERQIWTGLFSDPPPPPLRLVDKAAFFLGGGREVSGSESLSSSSDSITSSELKK